MLGVGSHEEIVEYFTSKGDTVFLSNGKFKGFVDPSGSRQPLSEFNEQHNVVGELRDSLRKWRELFPQKNIAITGYWTIERGITFCTTGFCFDYAILSTYHLNKLNKLIQLIGRTTGGKKFVEKIDKNELCIRFPIGVNLSNGLFKISTQDYNKPYTITDVDLPFNPSS